MSNVIFLDFDGVLNSTRSAVSRLNKSWEGASFDDKHWAQLDPIAIGLVERLCVEAPAIVVVSSTWRMFTTPEDFNLRFTEKGFGEISVVDVTPRTQKGHRGTEIQMWLDQFPHITNYVILDDDSDMLESQLPRFVQVPHKNGMLLEHYKQALNILNPTHESLVGLTRALNNEPAFDDE